jgi:hypothetical protein
MARIETAAQKRERLRREREAENKRLAEQRRSAVGGFFGDIWSGITGGGGEPPVTGQEELGLVPEFISDAAPGAYMPDTEALHASVANAAIRDPSGLLVDAIPPEELAARTESDRIAEEKRAEEEAAREAEIYAAGRIYGDYGEDVGAKRQRYLDAIAEIQSKSRQLNMIAGLTGGTSQASTFAQQALEQLETMEGYRTDERLEQLRQGLYYDQAGNWDAPKTKAEAYDRAIKFGASADEAATLSGHIPERAAFVNWQDVNPDSPTFGDSVSVRRGAGVTDADRREYGISDQARLARVGEPGVDPSTAAERQEEVIATFLEQDDVKGAANKLFTNLMNTSRGMGMDEVEKWQWVHSSLSRRDDRVAPNWYDSMDPTEEARLIDEGYEYAFSGGELVKLEPEVVGEVAEAALQQHLDNPFKRWNEERNALGAAEQGPAGWQTQTLVDALKIQPGDPNWTDTEQRLRRHMEMGYYTPQELRSKFGL